MVKEIFIFTAGLAAGAAATYGLLRKKFDMDLEAEIAESKAFYDEKVERLMHAAETTVNEAKKGLKKANNEAPKTDISEDVYDRDKIIEKLNYGAMFKGPAEDDDEEDEQEETVMNQTNTKGEHPEIISDDDYYSDDDFEKKVITYYSESNDFVDSKGELIEFEEMMDSIGNPDYLHEFGTYETDTLFVRNPKEQTDYEIILEEKEYDGE